MDISVEWWSDPEEFLASAEGFLEANALLTNVVGSTAATARDSGVSGSLYGLASDAEGQHLTAALWDKGRPLFLSHPRSAAAAAVGESVKANGIDVLGVSGPPSAVKAFASALGRGDCLARRARRLGLFDAPDHVSSVAGVGGKPRQATPEDVELLQGWVDRLTLDTTSKPFAVQRTMAQVYSNVFVWTLNDKPVAMAQVSPRTFGVKRISWLYSPTIYSGRRYELALAVHLVKQMHGDGDMPCLFLDAERDTWVRSFHSVGFRELMVSETWVLAS